LTAPDGWRARSRPFVLAALGGVLCFLGFVGFGVWPLMLIGIAPLWQALEESREGRAHTVAGVGFVFGVVGYAGGFFSLWRIVDVFLGGRVWVGALLWLAYAGWFGVRFALYALVYRRLRRLGWPVVVAALPPWLAIEWLYPQLFPVYYGHALVEQIELIQIADLGGPLSLTALVLSVNLAVLEGWRWRRGERLLPSRVWLAVALVVAATWIYGAVRLRQIDAVLAGAPALRIGIVQGNLGVLEKGRDATSDHRRYVEQTRELLADGAVDLVVWPETVYTRGLRRPLPISGQMIREDLPVPLLFGAASVVGESGRRLAYNSALLVGEDGVIRDAYDKNLLIPFTEYVPFAAGGALAGLLEDSSRFTASTATPVLRLGPWRISTPICYEAIRPSFVRRMVREGQPNLIATLANDSWFGDSQEPGIHLALAKFRAVEHRRYLVRATNSGVSAVVDPVGRELARSGLLRRENLRATVRLSEEGTLYTAWGDWPGWISFLLTAVAMARGGRRES
jgi:apolipoprotein N-acyltransferase